MTATDTLYRVLVKNSDGHPLVSLLASDFIEATALALAEHTIYAMTVPPVLISIEPVTL